ncbi:D-alanyl-D-alanine carboxypeptidase family protein [Bacillus sp. S/N-304-OC-R1]|uniref:M15 family metallopeptidase n=1 Tax=Bacillus sp. S/N-304-OC-R1 TaxID=2758034 RepID=UPI001C8D9538|nr:M15 family metallopeptidase [Bacillus sp. S/N-304-OC-R1]MBY0122741.1 D-alanyl-D-alanine carboxypeptidase family protein [Bacillus sp. S/N-304-OC-R1]
MKKVIALTALSSIMLAGCNGLQPYLDKIPFLQKEEAHNNQDDEKSKEAAIDETEEGSSKENKDNNNKQESGIPSLEADFFNDVITVDGKKVIQNPTNFMALVNKQYSLPDGYEPEDLMRPNVMFSFGDQDIEKAYLRQEAAKALEAMFTEAKKYDLHFFAVSGYRSFDRQKAVFDAEVNKYGEEKAVQAVAIPGSSEHQTGLAMDISSQSNNFELSEEFGDTKEGKWAAENAHRFGFILRYPKGKEEITGYKFEPWHFRYVGKDAAKTIYEKHLTLEEYFEIVKKI